MPLIPAGSRPYGFEFKRKGGRTYAEAGYKIGGKKVPLVVVPVPGPDRRK